MLTYREDSLCQFRTNNIYILYRIGRQRKLCKKLPINLLVPLNFPLPALVTCVLESVSIDLE